MNLATIRSDGSSTRKVLVVEDEKDIRDLIRYNLEQDGFAVLESDEGELALALVKRERPALVILDIMLPGMSGLDVCRAIRYDEETAAVPIVMLTARAAEVDKVVGLEMGADDYITKPFSPRELLARIQAVLRRASPGAAAEAFEAGALKLDPVSHRVMAGEQTVPLGPTEYRLLQFFMEHPERVYTRGQLLDRIWGGNVYVEERTVDVHIRRLRKALEPFGCDALVQTVRGSGYRFSTRPE